MVAAKMWEKPQGLDSGARVDYKKALESMMVPRKKLIETYQLE